MAITSLDTVHTISSDRKGNRFETQQLRDIFATTRVPGRDIDSLKSSPRSSHAVLFSNRHIFRVCILDRQSRPIPVSVMIQQVQNVLQISSAKPKPVNIALYSTFMGRQCWAELRHRYMESSPEAIDNSALHTTLPSDQDERLKLAKEDINCVYSDKVLGFSGFPDGTVAGRVDHSVADGGLLVLLWQHLSALRISVEDKDPTQHLLNANSPKEIHIGIESLRQPSPIQAPAFLRKSIISKIPQDPNLAHILRYTKLSHAIYLFAYQGALLSICDESDCSIHEPVSTRNYAEGRCDRHYVTTKELVSFCRALEVNAPMESLILDFKKALQKYRAGLESTRKGQGFGAAIGILEKSLSLMKDSKSKDQIMQAAKTFKRRGALFTGFPFAPAVDAVEGFISAANRVSCVYIGHESELIICLTGSGTFCGMLHRISKLTEENISAITQAVLTSGLVSI